MSMDTFPMRVDEKIRNNRNRRSDPFSRRRFQHANGKENDDSDPLKAKTTPSNRVLYITQP